MLLGSGGHDVDGKELVVVASVVAVLDEQGMVDVVVVPPLPP